ncbi:MAG: hypothetical protein WCX46_04250 [Candidatus Paceibacterota bacterium]
MPSTYEQLKSIIVKAVPEIMGIKECPACWEYPCECSYKFIPTERPITLEDVFIVLGEGYAHELTQLKEGFINWKFDSEEPGFSWQLGKPLESQSEETQEALLNILK